MIEDRSAAPPGGEELAELLLLQRSGLFDGAWFLARNPDLAESGLDPLTHFHRWGWRENRLPNAYFDSAWYVEQNPDVATSGVNPLLHYARYGEAEGRQPCPHFDPAWYRGHYAVPPTVLCLAHFLHRRAGGGVSPIPEFDAPYYVGRYADVAAAGMDPFEHYLVQGAAEDRVPAPGFDPGWYRDRYLRHQRGAVPLLHFRQNRFLSGVHPCRPEGETDIPSEVRRNTRPGPLFEEVEPAAAGAAVRAKVLAFYLPQFHPVPENDLWWGRGFTEWTNVSRALPRFAGHYQPRTPRDLGHYTLGPEVLRRQARMARDAGLHGFVFYFYWFNGRRLLDAPLEALLADPSLDLPFCLMWANENWTRRWDGSEHEVLLSQDYRPADEDGLVAEFLRHFADARYVRLKGRPVLMVYRAGLIPPGAVARWRALFRERGEDPIFVMSQSFHDRDPRRAGMDAAVEFPPHKLTDGLELLNPSLTMLDHGATGQVFSYDAVAAASDLSPQPFPLIRTAVPGWDNDPRRQGLGMALHGATPAAFGAWMERLITAAREQPVEGEAIVCVNAWNEWGEGAYLEPDVHFGGAFLNAAARAISGSGGAERCRLLLVGHDAFPAGAQLLLLNIGRSLREVRGWEVAFLLGGDGALLKEYQRVAPTTVLSPGADAARAVSRLRAAGFAAAVVNTAAAAHLLPELHAAGMECTFLVHELPRLLHERGLVEAARGAAELARHTVFGAPAVRDRFAELVRLRPGTAAVLPQGCYRAVDAEGSDGRARLGLPPGAVLAVGMGYADLRKGFDLFLGAWRAARRARGTVHFLWVGDIDPGVLAYLGGELAAAEAEGTFHHRPWSPAGGDWVAAADVFLLTSREDPLPTVVMEAMTAGVPTVAFEDSGGIPDLLRDYAAGTAVPLGDVGAMVAAIRPLLNRFNRAARVALANRARRGCDFESYVGQLLRLAAPEAIAADVSVVVPNYEYGRFLPGRLQSIFAQSHPVREVVVLDDASRDDSLRVVARTCAASGRRVRVVEAARNSGSVFKQWHRAARLAEGEFLWLAEADDASEPGFLAALCGALRAEPDAVMAFCDSRAVDADGAALWPDHQAYYAASGAALLREDGVFEAAEVLRLCLAERNLILNASAVVFRRTALLQALDRCAAELAGFRMAGDWRLYAELLAGGGKVAYVARPLNVHRRHGDSVTHRLPPEQHLAEVERMHRHMRGVLGRRRGLVPGQRRALEAARRALAGEG